MTVSTIVVGYDGSPHALSALQAAVDIVADDGAVDVVTAYHMPSPRETDRAGVWAAVPKESRDNFDILATPRGFLRDAEEFLAERGIATRVISSVTIRPVPSSTSQMT